MQSFKLKFSGVTILQGVEFPIFLLIFEWALQQCSATALPVIIISTHCRRDVASETGFKQDSPNPNPDSDSLIECTFSYWVRIRIRYVSESGFVNWISPKSVIHWRKIMYISCIVHNSLVFNVFQRSLNIWKTCYFTRVKWLKSVNDWNVGCIFQIYFPYEVNNKLS